MSLDIDQIWYRNSVLSYILLPFAWLFAAIAMLRRLAYRFGILKVVSLPVPVIVVGNITVGGTGKTPLVASIVNHLLSVGRRPGIISRGYRGDSEQWPVLLDAQSSARLVGDEPLMLFQRCGCPVVVGPDRIAAAKMLLAQTPCDVIVSDDGLQHYRLERQVEIAVIDGVRKFGNGRCLPAGPLREKPTRLRSVDIVVVNDGDWPNAYKMSFTLQAAVSLQDNTITRPLSDFQAGSIHAVAGIGHPDRFFNSLRDLGLSVIEHPFPDHHSFRREDCVFEDDFPVVMTEKDAVKYSEFSVINQYYVPISVTLDEEVYRIIEKKIE